MSVVTGQWDFQKKTNLTCYLQLVFNVVFKGYISLIAGSI